MLEIALGLIAPALQLPVAVILARSGLYRRFPMFFSYNSYSICASLIMAVTNAFSRTNTYLHIYWIGQAIYTILGLLAINESFNAVFLRYFRGRLWFRFLAPSLALTVLCLVVWKWILHPPMEANWLMTVLISFDLASHYMLSSIFGLFALMVIFRQPGWRQYPFGIMKGYGLANIVGMLADLLRSDLGKSMNWIFVYLPAAAYFIACLIWLGAFLRPEPSEPERGPASLVNLDELQAVLERLVKAIR